MSRNKEHRGAAFGGRPIGSVFFVSAHLSFYIMNIYGYSLYIPYIFHIYICPKCFPYVLPSKFMIFKIHTKENIWNILRTYKYEIYKEYIRNIHTYSQYKK